MPVNTIIQLRRDTAANWLVAPDTLGRGVLYAGEIGFETDTIDLKLVMEAHPGLTWIILELVES